MNKFGYLTRNWNTYCMQVPFILPFSALGSHPGDPSFGFLFFMEHIFLCACWSFTFFLVIVQVLFHFKTLVVFFVDDLCKFLMYSKEQLLIRYIMYKYLFPFCGLYFYFLDSTLWCTKVFKLEEMQTIHYHMDIITAGGFPGSSAGKESTCNAGDSSLIPGLGRSPGEGNGNPLQCSCLENPMDRGVWWATVHGSIKSRTRLNE